MFLWTPILLALGLAMSLLSGQSSAGDFTVLVSKGPNEFLPQVIHVKSGDRIEWENRDTQEHVLIMQKSVRKGGESVSVLEVNAAIVPEGRFDYQFQHPGRHPYFCGVHTNMWGMVVVE